MASAGDEAPATGERGEGLRGSRQGQEIRDTALRLPFAHRLRFEVAGVLNSHKLPDVLGCYPDCMMFTWHLIRASEHLLDRAAALAEDGRLHTYLSHHLGEERGHAAWLAEDLYALGILVERELTPVAASTLIGMVMYFVEFVDPASLLGYMLVMESFPMREEILVQLEHKWGERAVRTARYHAKHDPAHAADLYAEINALEPSRQGRVRHVALSAATLFAAHSQEIANGAT